MKFAPVALLAMLSILATGPIAEARPGPADFGASLLLASPSCAQQVAPMHVAAVNAARPACCMGQVRCSQYLATTRINRAHDAPHT